MSSYIFIPGNKSRGIGYKIYRLGANVRWPDGNSVDHLVLVGQRVIEKPSGYDWGWEGAVYESVEAAINVAEKASDESLYLHYDAEEFASYIRSFATNSFSFERSPVVKWHPDYGYFFDWWKTPLQGYMTCDRDRLIMWENIRRRVVRYMFKW